MMCLVCLVGCLWDKVRGYWHRSSLYMIVVFKRGVVSGK